MRKRLLDFIVCPDCKASFQIEVFLEQNGVVKEGLLRCPLCQAEYIIVDFIPRIIDTAIDEYPDFIQRYRLSIKKNKASDTKESGAEAISQKTRRSFGYQWTRRKFSQIIPKFEEGFFNYVYPLDRDFFNGKIGIDIGCGFGRHIYYAAKLGAEIVGIDFSRAIDSAFNNTKHLSNVHLMQADIYNLPLRENCFDFVYSIGVLHHLLDPEKGFRAILPLLKPKGYVSIWVYSKSRPIVNFIIECVRLITKRIPHNLLYLLSIILSAMERLFIIMPYKILNRLPIIKASLEKIVFRRIKIYSEYPFNVLTADWFDRLSAPIRHYYSEKQMQDWFMRANLKLITISPTYGYGWRVFGQKP